MSQSMSEKIMHILKITAEAAGYGEPQSIPEIVGGLIGVFLSLLGVIFLILILYGGYIWMTSAGNETKVLQAKKIISNAIVGIIIIMSAYAITSFVFQAVK
jgi:TRAP-type C4-dicarboxylate transport system permease small subunit